MRALLPCVRPHSPRSLRPVRLLHLPCARRRRRASPRGESGSIAPAAGPGKGGAGIPRGPDNRQEDQTAQLLSRLAIRPMLTTQVYEFVVTTSHLSYFLAFYETFTSLALARPRRARPLAVRVRCRGRACCDAAPRMAPIRSPRMPATEPEREKASAAVPLIRGRVPAAHEREHTEREMYESGWAEERAAATPGAHSEPWLNVCDLHEPCSRPALEWMLAQP